ncbi:MAG: helix-turn-helix domain-containing protein [Chloroflexi bacterium]|nr:helix-turn-helix domain-containing protein [Chloroflexota bacterium]
MNAARSDRSGRADDSDSPDDRRAQGRASYAAGAWTDAHQALTEADRAAPLDVPDLERAGTAAALIGRQTEAIELWGRAHHAALETGDLPAAVRHAFWIGMTLLQGGEPARGGGWMNRATRIVEDNQLDCVEAGYILVPQGLRALGEGDPVTAFERFERAAGIAARFGDGDLAVLGCLGRGVALVHQSDIAGGVALLDEALVAVAAGEVGAIVVGTVYCAAIETFEEIFDLHRAQEWTAALGAWLDAQPDLVPFRGRCLVYRAELLQFHGAWLEAIDEVMQAREWLSRPPPEPAVGEAIYQRAELHRLQGELAEADDAYREASRWGRRGEPGLALLRLAQGNIVGAAAVMRRALDEAVDPPGRARLLEPAVEIAVASGDATAARAALDELAEMAAAVDGSLLTGIAARAAGLVMLSEEDPRAALAAFRRSAAVWDELGAPYQSARVRVGIGQAMRQLGDLEGAALEFDAARAVFERLGAVTDQVLLDRVLGAGGADGVAAGGRPGGLSAREVEVLRLVAAGETNRAIAAELGISERTVDRHVSNLFTKLDVSSRAAATAFAYEHDLV